MKHSLELILVIAVNLCDSTFLCQIFDSSNKSLEQYCINYSRPLPYGKCLTVAELKVESSQVDQLKIGGCDPEIVLDTVKRFQQNLRVLDISYSQYTHLDWFNVTLDKLQIFNASHNELMNLSWNIFSAFPVIIEMDISYNKLNSTHMESMGSKVLQKLQKLHLSHNKFTSDVDIYNFPSQSVDYIDLKDNQIKYIDLFPYEKYKNLKELHLEGNPYLTIKCELLKGMSKGKLTSVFLSWSNLRAVSTICVSCQNKGISIVRTNGTNEGIFITSDGKFEFHCRDKCFENVVYFDAECNNFQNGSEVLQNIGSKIENIKLDRNFVGELDANAFNRFTQLYTLELSGTNLTWFDVNMLRNRLGHISSVDISNNNLKKLHNIPSLQNSGLRLIINGNQIENAYEIMEYLRPHLWNLDLSGGNFIGKLNMTTFQKLTQLNNLNLSNTHLVLPDDSNPFGTLQNLAVLDLSHNNLENFNFSILSDTLYHLRDLRLVECRIKNISTVIEYLGPYISKLDLSKNAAHGYSNFELSLLKHQPQLEFLDISNNELKAINFKSFSFDRRIYINLEGNDLTELTNLHEARPREMLMELNIANNRLPCDFLKQLKHDYDDKIDRISLDEYSWQQKPDIDCRTSTESIKGFLSNVYDTIKFW